MRIHFTTCKRKIDMLKTVRMKKDNNFSGRPFSYLIKRPSDEIEIANSLVVYRSRPVRINWWKYIFNTKLLSYLDSWCLKSSKSYQPNLINVLSLVIYYPKTKAHAGPVLDIWLMQMFSAWWITLSVYLIVTFA